MDNKPMFLLNAEEARKLVREHKETNALEGVFHRIRASAKIGCQCLELKKSELTHFQADLLRLIGYRVVPNMTSACGPHERSELDSWTVFWSES